MVPRAASARAGTWRLLPKAPLTKSPGQISAVWTGHEMIIHALYFPSSGGGSGCERIASAGCSDRTIRRRLAEWAELGLAEAPCGGERAGPSPVDRRKGGLKRSVASDGYGIPLGIASAGANRHDSPRLAPTLQAASRQLDHILPENRSCHLDRARQHRCPPAAR